jgi:hypothetical protein
MSLELTTLASTRPRDARAPRPFFLPSAGCCGAVGEQAHMVAARSSGRHMGGLRPWRAEHDIGATATDSPPHTGGVRLTRSSMLPPSSASRLADFSRGGGHGRPLARYVEAGAWMESPGMGPTQGQSSLGVGSMPAKGQGPRPPGHRDHGSADERQAGEVGRWRRRRGLKNYDMWDQLTWDKKLNCCWWWWWTNYFCT